MSERETADVIWAVKETASRAGAHSEGYEGMPYATKYIRADIAEQREAELVEVLKYTREILPSEVWSRDVRNMIDALLAKHES